MAAIKKFEGFDNKNDIFDLIDKFDKSTITEMDISIIFPCVYGEIDIKLTKSPNGNKIEKSNKTETSVDVDKRENINVTAAKPDTSEIAGKTITAPLVGTFYSSSSPDSEPYVKVGDKVTKGMVVCIIEAMKTMNEIESETDGEIVEVLINNASPVEYGQSLFRLK